MTDPWEAAGKLFLITATLGVAAIGLVSLLLA